jgi:hypothetical protein
MGLEAENIAFHFNFQAVIDQSTLETIAVFLKVQASGVSLLALKCVVLLHNLKYYCKKVWLLSKECLKLHFRAQSVSGNNQM